jgi:hypothetical protein
MNNYVKILPIEVKIDLIKSGFVPKAEKSFWQPVKHLAWLGTIIDTEYGYYKIPEDRVEKIINTITDICSCLSVRKTVYVRKVASLVGQIISTYSVIGNIIYLMTKHLSIDINSSLLGTRTLSCPILALNSLCFGETIFSLLM